MSEFGNDNKTHEHLFTGNLYFFHAFDVGDDINLQKVRDSGAVVPQPLTLSRYFKNYHIPLAFDLSGGHRGSYMSAKIHNFGAVSFIYKVPFHDTLFNIRKNLEAMDAQFDKQSFIDAEAVFGKLKTFVSKPNFFHTRSSYVMIQVDQQPDLFDTVKLKETYGSIIASTLRFEKETLSESQKNEILLSAIGYYRGDLMVVDTEATFVYDDDYQDLIQFIEFANIQHLELRYFDRILDQQLYYIYEGRTRKVPLISYLPFLGTLAKGPIDDLGRLKVDISVVVERLEGSIMLAGDPYYSEFYGLLIEKLELKNLKDDINNKLSIVGSVLSVLQNKTDAIREDMLTVSIIVLILIELVIGILSYLK